MERVEAVLHYAGWMRFHVERVEEVLHSETAARGGGA